MIKRKESTQNIQPCRVEPWCSSFRVRWLIHGFPHGPQSDSHTFIPSAPSSNRTSGFPRYGSPTIFPMCLSVTKHPDYPNWHNPSLTSILLWSLRLPLVESLCFRFRNIRSLSLTNPFSFRSRFRPDDGNLV